MSKISKKHDSEKIEARKGFYLLPNLLTTGTLFAGFYAIVAAMNNNYSIAGIAIYVGLLTDCLDGRIARLIKADSEFGAQYDSLSDLICFGMAPALISYNLGLHSLGKIGWLLSFWYVAATALRLARFNVQGAIEHDKSFFIGLPCPTAAAIVASTVWVISKYNLSFIGPISLASLTTTLGALMVCNIPYYSFKEIDLRGKVPFLAILAILAAYISLAYAPEFVLLAIFMLYLLSGPAGMIWRKIKHKS